MFYLSALTLDDVPKEVETLLELLQHRLRERDVHLTYLIEETKSDFFSKLQVMKSKGKLPHLIVCDYRLSEIYTNDVNHFFNLPHDMERVRDIAPNSIRVLLSGVMSQSEAVPYIESHNVADWLERSLLHGFVPKGGDAGDTVKVLSSFCQLAVDVHRGLEGSSMP